MSDIMVNNCFRGRCDSCSRIFRNFILNLNHKVICSWSNLRCRPCTSKKFIFISPSTILLSLVSLVRSGNASRNDALSYEGGLYTMPWPVVWYHRFIVIYCNWLFSSPSAFSIIPSFHCTWYFICVITKYLLLLIFYKSVLLSILYWVLFIKNQVYARTSRSIFFWWYQSF